MSIAAGPALRFSQRIALSDSPLGTQLSPERMTASDHFNIWEALGMVHEDVRTRQEVLRELKSPTPKGRERRRGFLKAITNTSH